MLLAKSESDSTSVAPSSPRSPKRAVYYVQSPSSRDSHDGDKSSTMQGQATPTYNSSMESPSHPSVLGRHSLASSGSRVSGTFRSSSRKVNRKRNGKGWTECNVIEEEGDYDDMLYGDQGFARRCHYLMALVGILVLFTLFCLIIWAASRPYRVRVAVKSLIVNNIYFGEGSDWTGVPTKLLTVNCSVKMIIDNPATFFGIHVSSNVNLIYTEITVATGQLKKYYQPRKSRRIVSVNLKGDKVPLYGAGTSLAASDNNGEVPFKFEFEIRSRGNVVGKLVKTKHRRHISCSLLIDSSNTKVIKFKEDSCSYD